MKRKSHEVQKALEMDLEILQNMAAKVMFVCPVRNRVKSVIMSRTFAAS